MDLQILIANLTSNVVEDRIEAAGAIGILGPKATKAVPALIVALDDTDQNVKKSVLYALGEIGVTAADALPTIRRVRREYRKNLRWMADHAISRIMRAKHNC